MSNPQNILGKFGSYNYHHMLMVCNNTEAAEELMNTSEITAFQRTPQSIRDEKLRFAPRSINGATSKNKYITLIDGTSDARFYITEASWENIIAMENTIGSDGIPESTSMSLDGELEIVEPLGAKFLNTLTNACDSLETDPVGLVFVLKTIFVGYNDDGTTEMISNIKPLLFINYDITAIFDSSGAKYKMAFVGAINGMGKLPHTQRIFNGLNFNIGDGNLSDTFKIISKNVNDKYKDFLQRAKFDFTKILYNNASSANKTLTAADAVSQANAFFDKNYRGVEYKVFAPEYDNQRYKAGDNESVRIKTKQELGSFNYGDNIGIEEIIKKVMASSTGVIDDGTGRGTKDGKKYIYKIVSGLKSSADKFIVEYYIKKYELAVVPFDAVSKGEDYKPAQGQLITFNYIFTGKNVDIKNFDIKMEMGMAFFQIAATTDTLPDTKTPLEGKTSTNIKAGGSAIVAGNGKTIRPKTPLFLGSKMKQPMARNTRNPGDSAHFQSLLNRHAALENIEAKMLIYGNPQLLDEMLIAPSALNKEETETPTKDATINPRWLNTPTLVKVNIKMPVDNSDVNTEYEDFWYTGFYSLFAVKHIFQDGEFLQELDLMSIPVAEKLDEKKDAPNLTEKQQKEKDKKLKTQDLAFINATAGLLGIELSEEKTKGENTKDPAKDGDKRKVVLSRWARRRQKKQGNS